MLEPPTPEPTPSPAPIIVYISGAVLQPGVYELPPEARVADLVVAAGGILPEADEVQVNMADVLVDSDHIHVPAVGETIPESLAAPQPDTTTASDALSETETIPVLDLNTATSTDLEQLPGIGPQKARQIVDYRDTHGPFMSVDDLQEVPGIGPRLFENVRIYLQVDGS